LTYFTSSALIKPMPKPLTSEMVNKIFKSLKIEEAAHAKELERENPVVQVVFEVGDIRSMRYNTAVKKFGPLYTL